MIKYKSAYKDACDKLVTERNCFMHKLSEIKDIYVFPVRQIISFAVMTEIKL